MGKAGAVPGGTACVREETLLLTTLHNYKGPFSFNSMCLKGLLGKEVNGPMSRLKGKHTWQEIYGSVNK